jgi:hypothetical protein
MREDLGEGPRDGNSGSGDVLENPTCKSKVYFSCGEDLLMVILYPFIVVQLLNINETQSLSSTYFVESQQNTDF